MIKHPNKSLGTLFPLLIHNILNKMESKRKSNKKNLARKKTQFKKGQTSHLTSGTTYEKSTIDDTVTLVKRPNQEEFYDAVNAQSSDLECLLPSKLRPEKCINDDIVSDFTPSEESEENVIVNLHKMSNLITAFQPHSCENAFPELKIEKRQGLCITVQVSCRNCSFVSNSIELFTTVKSTETPGPDPGALNTSLLIPVLKSKVGINDVLHMLTCLNIKTPDRRGLQRKFNRLSDLMVDINKKQLCENQSYVKHVLEMAGRDNLVDVEVDSSYNNRPQPGCEAATQTFCPIVEQCTTKKLPLNIETANVNCPSKSCAHNTTSCKKNYSADDTISSTESKFVKKHLKSINEQGFVKIKSVTSDASGQVIKAVQDYEKESNIPTRHYKCFVHKLRTFQKNFQSVKLSSTLSGRRKNIFMRKLSSSVRARIRVELIRIKRSSRSENSFVERAYKSIENIMACFANDHQNCRHASLTCTAHLDRYCASHLPYGRHLELNQSDINKLKLIITKHFSKAELPKIARLSTTNKCESLHQKVFTYAPKNTIWTRNFTGLCHSAIHAASVGNGKSCIILARTIGLKYKRTDPFISQMLKVDRMNRYFAQRKKTQKYKSQRFNAKRRKCNKEPQENTIFNTNDEHLIEEHNYANRI